MPVRPVTRDQVWLFPPTLGELIPLDHPARFVAAFVENIDRRGWAELGISLDGAWLGAAAYNPRVLLPVWLYGFMTGVRSARKLEAACRDQLSFLWLTGWQFPDHNTLWRFYREHRKPMRKILKRTVRTAVRLGLVDLAVQAIDGSKIAANAGRARTLDQEALVGLLERTEKAIRDMEGQNSTPSEMTAPRLPENLAQIETLNEEVRSALQDIRTEEQAETLESKAQESKPSEMTVPRLPEHLAQVETLNNEEVRGALRDIRTEEQAETLESKAQASESNDAVSPQSVGTMPQEVPAESEPTADKSQASESNNAVSPQSAETMLQEVPAESEPSPIPDEAQASESSDAASPQPAAGTMPQEVPAEDEPSPIPDEAQAGTPSDAAKPEWTQKLARKQEFKKQVRAALEILRAEGAASVNLTDMDARLVKGRQGIITGYNAQAVVSPLNPKVAGVTGRLITATDVTNEAYDQGQTIPMLEAAEANIGQRAGVSLFDGGYHSGPNLEACTEKGYNVLMAESQRNPLEQPYHKDRFQYDPETDTYRCPNSQTLRLSCVVTRSDRPEKRVYRSPAAVCRACLAHDNCTKQQRQGRTVEVGPHEEKLREHRTLMETPQAKAVYRQRKELVEPVFGTMKEQQAARHFLLRGSENVRSEWSLLCTAFNLRTLCRVWQRRPLAKFEMVYTGAVG